MIDIREVILVLEDELLLPYSIEKAAGMQVAIDALHYQYHIPKDCPVLLEMRETRVPFS